MNYAELRKLAQEATPGPWSVSEEPGVEPLCAIHAEGDTTVHFASFVSKKDASFIAAANPSTIIALLDRIAELEAGMKPLADYAKDRVAHDPAWKGIDAVNVWVSIDDLRRAARLLEPKP